jgi:DNA-binding IclR family transcriptional regulator
MVILAEVSGSHLVTVAAEIGTRWPIHATSTGKAFLAALAPDAWRELLALPLARFTPATVVDLEELERELEQVRIQGFATASGEVEAGASAAAAVLLNSIGDPVGAISFSGPTSRLTPHRLSMLGRDLASVAARLAPRIHTMD